MSAAAVLATIVASGSASGGGGGGLNYPKATVSVPDVSVNGDGVTPGHVVCHSNGGGARTYGGGVQIVGNIGDFDLEVKSSTHFGGFGWDAEADNSSGSPAAMTIFAICGENHFKYPSASAGIPPGAQVQRKVSCPKHTTLTGGGVETSTFSHKVEVASTLPADGRDADKKADDAWLGVANNGEDSLSAQMTVTAICAKSGKYVRASSKRRPLPDNSQESAAAHCPKGTQVTGGGVDVSGVDDGIEVANTFPFDNADPGSAPDNGWFGSANNDSTGSSQTMRTFAICQK